ncbi:glycosyltransferase 87 family protein [Arthrobacter sp. UM1]|uniref:glycosyltransferase 87 family protein n=1 Tax=Arthrobacter sp. UM1 TaxID=2766776 RepID=UPI001CF6F102|nr:glycosyltransferase 87 family protein [Arthrobacter sp. UM1]MCB4208712.1 DUF2029 domain-containing protein [Arthrobacter sp. UM1]
MSPASPPRRPAEGAPPRGEHRPARWTGAVGLLLAVASVLVFVHECIDLQVYQAGARTLLQNPAALYEGGLQLELPARLPFTYPPFAAALFIPVSFLPVAFAGPLMAVLSLGLTYAVMRALLRRLVPLLPAGWARFASPMLLTGVLAWTGPLRSTMSFGQINAILFGLVCLACLRWGWGFLAGLVIGLTAGVKLTPLVFGIVPLARRSWSCIAGMAVGFAGSIALTWAALPALSHQYWLQVIRDTSRIGSIGFFDNVSVRAVLARFDADSQIAWLILALLLIGLVYTALRCLPRETDTLTLIGLASSLMLLISPISWAHHAVWLPVILWSWFALAWRLPSARRPLAVLGALLAFTLGVSNRVFAVFLPGGGDPSGSPLWDAYVSLPTAVLVASVVVIAAAAVRHRGPTTAE